MATMENPLARCCMKLKRSISALKGQLTRERKKNAEARELVQLLEWAKLRVSYRYYTGTDNYDIYPFCSSKNYRFENTSLLNALREARKIVESQP
jgi:hypothetical protein